ncbi:MAG: hypothetical protein WB782_07035 [Thermoplasmata archaeon]
MIALDVVSVVIAIVALLVAVVSTVLLLLFEYYRRPSLVFVEHQDSWPGGDPTNQVMWYHLKVRNAKPPQWFGRDAALGCRATVEFFNAGDASRLPVGQITVHWTNQGEPKSNGRFDHSLVPACQRIDVGYREEMFDVVVKKEGDPAFYATDPWNVYSEPTAWDKIRIEEKSCIIHVQVESINSGRTWTARYLIKNEGPHLTDIDLSPL